MVTDKQVAKLASSIMAAGSMIMTGLCLLAIMTLQAHCIGAG